MNLACVVLAAGLGTRMNSSLPKVLHTLSGVPLLQFVLDTLHELKLQKIILIVGKHSEKIKESLRNTGAISFAQQRKAKGTGDAVVTAIPFLRRFRGTVLIINGDTPLVTKETLKKFLALHKKRGNALSLISFVTQHPGSYGRIIRDGRGHVLSIVEDRDATASQKMIQEVNSGVYAIEPEALRLAEEIRMNELKGEYYLTDIVSITRNKGMKVNAFCIGSESEFIGINTREELEIARQILKDRMIRRWQDRGIRFVDPQTVFLSSHPDIGKGTVIYPNVHIEGHTRIGKGCTIYPNVRIVDSIIGNGSIIKDSTLIEESVIENGASVGPFAHIRPGSHIGAGAKIGNFVEIKKSVIGAGTKAMHLTYIGDAKVGKGVNIGAGTITCNYDGYKKHVTTVEDGVFIGSDSQLIAPVRIAKGAYVGAGSTITQDVPSNALALTRTQQKHIEDWALTRKFKVKGARSKALSAKSKMHKNKK